MPFGWIPRAQDFPRRNRIVSGMSFGVVVVEAAARSGTLHTARFALDQGREVLAVPGSPLDPRAEGTNRLIRQGATLVTNAEEIMETLRPLIGREPPTTDGAGEPGADDMPLDAVDDAIRAAIVAALSPVPVAIDDIILHTGMKPAIVNCVLIELQVAGRLERHGGQLVSLIG
jgi:DNA processing protein